MTQPPLSVVVAVCTKDRPHELQRCLAALSQGSPGLTVVVVDAGRDTRGAEVCATAPAGLRVLHRTARPGLAAQRNLAVASALDLAAEVLVFVDDDVVVGPGFAPTVVAELRARPEAAAVGAVVIDEPPVRLVGLKSFFLLWSRRPGAVLPSGRNVIGHAPGPPLPRRVQWLSTCAVGLRLSMLGALRFDERLSGYSYGEDLDLTWRLGREHPLLVTGQPEVRHLLSRDGRPAPGPLARRRTVLLHAWVSEQRGAGLSPPLFWWSVLGELLIGILQALTRRPGAAAGVRGVAEGAWQILRHGSSRAQP